PVPVAPVTAPRISAAPVAAAQPPVAAPVPPRPALPRPAVTATPTALPSRSEPKPALAAADEYRVKSGDTLYRIATRAQRSGVSLDQMLVSLYRSNPQAFMGNNMNRLKAGVVLSLPNAEAVGGVPEAEARQVIQAQSEDFSAYRQRLAGAVPQAKTEGTTRQASGKVQASVDDRRQGATPTPDKLTLSKGSAAARSAAADSTVSKDQEKKAADARVAELSKNVDELKKLADATAAAAASKPTAATPSAAAPAAAGSAPGSAIAAASAAVAPAVAASVPAIAVAAAPALPASVAVVPKPAAPVAAASVATAAPAPAPEEPGMLSSLLDDNPLAVGLGGLAILLLAGFGVYRFARRSRHDSGETSFLESRLQPDSFFGASGGQRIDTRDAGGASSSMSYSLSKLDAIGDVDPVAEADVYLAYGRDLQAEEILKEAMRSSPERMAIRTKLLEVYAKRRDTKGFELLATQLYSLTGGDGEDWAKAQELGAEIDPENPLFQPGGMPVPALGRGGEVIEPLGASTMPQSVLPSPSKFAAAAGGEMALDSGSMDLDLDLGDPQAGVATSPSALEATQAFAPEPHPVDDRADDHSGSLDFVVPEMPETLDPPVTATADPATQPEPFDLSDISLDLDLPPESNHGALPAASQSGAPLDGLELPSLEEGGSDDPLVRKLELAEEFRQIGDADGARDLLQEVVAKASGALKSRAQSMLADLG
ncbi:MAG: FimV/HubP family polar landmark protein, partial [Burkholderiaceae bacterium]